LNREELKQFINECLESGEWTLPEGAIPEAYIAEQVDAILKTHPEIQGVKGSDLATTIDKRSDTPLMDIVRYERAMQKGDRKVIEEMQAKDVVVGTTTEGGHLVPTEDSLELINLVFKDSNVADHLRKIPMETNSLIFPVMSAGLTPYTVIESTDADPYTAGSTVTTQTNPTFTTATITLYNHSAYTRISNEMLEYSNPGVEAIIREDITGGISSAFDWSVFHGTGTAGADGTASSVTGLETLITTNVENAGGAPSFDDILDLMVPEDNTAGDLKIFCAPAARRALAGVKGNDGQYIYDPSVRDGGVPVIWGMPLITNNRISKTLGSGAETAIFSGAFGKSGLMGFKGGIKIIVDGLSGSQYNSTYIAAHSYMGFQVASEDHFAILGGVSV